MASPSLACESNFMASTSNGNDNNDAKSKPRSRWRKNFFFFLCMFLSFPISQPAATRHVPSSTCEPFLNPPALLWNPRQTFYFLINSFLRPIPSWLLIFWDILIFPFHKQFSSSLSLVRDLNFHVKCRVVLIHVWLRTACCFAIICFILPQRSSASFKNITIFSPKLAQLSRRDDRNWGRIVVEKKSQDSFYYCRIECFISWIIQCDDTFDFSFKNT